MDSYERSRRLGLSEMSRMRRPMRVNGHSLLDVPRTAPECDSTAIEEWHADLCEPSSHKRARRECLPSDSRTAQAASPQFRKRRPGLADEDRRPDWAQRGVRACRNRIVETRARFGGPLCARRCSGRYRDLRIGRPTKADRQRGKSRRRSRAWAFGSGHDVCDSLPAGCSDLSCFVPLLLDRALHRCHSTLRRASSQNAASESHVMYATS
jgi:hypothetical protein